MTLQQHLELICKYLPYKVMYSHNGNMAELMPYHLGMHLKNIERGDDWKLVLRPLSDLVKPCLEDGKIPILKLLDIHTGAKWSNTEYVEIHNSPFEWGAHMGRYWFVYSEQDGFLFSDNNLKSFSKVRNQAKLFDKLQQWYFFLGDQSLFEKEIIDINTLK